MAGSIPDFTKPLTPQWLSDAEGGRDLVRQAGISGFFYHWYSNWALKLAGCDLHSDIALNLIDASAVQSPLFFDDKKLVLSPYDPQVSQSDLGYRYIKFMTFDSDDLSAESDDESSDSKRVSIFESLNISSQMVRDYRDWKSNNIFLCQQPYMSKRFGN